MTYFHPVLGLTVLAALVWVGLLGLQLRGARRDRARLAARHDRWATRVYWAMLATWLVGAASSALARPDLTFAASQHFLSAALLLALLTGSALSARAMRRGSTAARDWHPWLGIAAMLLAALHAAAGLRLTP